MIEDYVRARKLGLKQRNQDVSAGRYPYVPAFDELFATQDLGAEVPMGVMEIPVSLVAGTRTKGRQNTFASNFMPLLGADTEFAMKWSNVYDAQRNEGLRDPIIAYEYLQHFYVLEGNKRLSVVRFVGNPSISASVTRIMPRGGEERELRVYDEFVRFFKVAPVYGLDFSQEGSFERLAGCLGQDLVNPWPDEAVHTLRSAFAKFSSVLARRRDGRVTLSTADAFLVYLRIHGIDSLVSDSPRQVEEKLSAIMGELAVASTSDPVVFLEDPASVPAKSSIVPSIMSSIRSVVDARPFKVAFVYDADPDSSSWVWSHEEGRLELERRMAGRVETTAFMGCADDASFSKAIEAAVADKSDLVVTTDAGLSENTLKAAVANPGTIFINCSLYHAASSMRAFYGRMYEAKFIAGALAASLADGHDVGYVAGAPTFGSVAEINAFALGAQLVDAHARVHLKWYSVDGDEWRRALADEGVRVISGRDIVKFGDDDFGLYRVEPDGTFTHYACPVWNWGRYLELIVQSIRDGRWEGATGDAGHVLNYWWGMSAGVIDVELFDDLPQSARKLAACLRDAVVRGVVSPFSGELVSQSGVEHRVGDPDLTPSDIVGMRWLNANVVGKLPQREELDAEGAREVSLGGVIDDTPGRASLS
jgi:basic membrane lipoprotein Med (substrate-binding protein (PBP1-ABC) superfamily)